MDLPHDRILLVSDGIATSGERDHAKLRDAVSRLQAGGVKRFDAVVDGGIQDPVLLAHLTRSDLPRQKVQRFDPDRGY